MRASVEILPERIPLLGSFGLAQQLGCVNDQPSCPNARTCFCFSSFKTLMGEHLKREGGFLLGGFLQFGFAKAELILLVEETDRIEGLAAGKGPVIKVVDAVASKHEAEARSCKGVEWTSTPSKSKMTA